jgi:DNA transformation protein
MPVTDSFIAFVVDQLAGCGAITTKRMFGGVGVYAGDVFFALIAADLFYLKVDESNRGDFEAAGTGPFKPYADDREIFQYYEVPLVVLEDADELARWARKAIRVAELKRTLKRASRRKWIRARR